jgi:hypothetical protein
MIPAAWNKKRYDVMGEKGDAIFICDSYTDASDRAIFLAAVNKYGLLFDTISGL